MTTSHDPQESSEQQLAANLLLAAFEHDSSSPYPANVQQTTYLARQLQQRAGELQTPQERKQQAELDRMIQSPHDKDTLVQLTDQAFRSDVPYRAADQMVHILDVQGIPRFFSPFERTLLKGFQSFGSYLPGVAVPLVKEKMHHETANVVLPAEREMLTSHLAARRREGLRMNVNYLGEALLGEQEAERRLNAYLHALQMPEIEVISVKISTIYSQISALARQHTLAVLCDRLELLYRAAAKMHYTRSDGIQVRKFVYLDMEEYRDLSITAEAFMRTLNRDGLKDIPAGIALQAYIPDSYRWHQRINEWARHRIASGGAPVTIRIVKGANMEMERVDASLHGWPQAPYKRKTETDANFKRMLLCAMRPENLAAVRLGVASHNLFDLAYGLVLAVEQDALNLVQFEMLEGMANHQRRALFELCNNVLLYAPACTKEDFIYAIGYLIRRLDENTGPENFLRHAFKLEVDSTEWHQLEQGFLKSFDEMPRVSDDARRNQDRNQPPPPPPEDPRPWHEFANEPDTDFALPQNTAWAEEIVQRWEPRCGESAEQIPLMIDGEAIMDGREMRASYDPSRPDTVVAHYRQANEEDIERALRCAQVDDDGWRSLASYDRNVILRNVAQEIRLARTDLMGAAMAEGGKILSESDPEVSEAVDFVEFYRRTAEDFAALEGVSAVGCGVAVVVSPWNFPIAIPCGGIAAALAAGNTVILKPASDTVLVAYHLCQCFWRGGVSPKTLQLVPCAGNSTGQHLVAHHEVNAVVLTGGTETAFNMLRHKPETNLLAETGGKNATIVTAMADRDMAVKNVIHSAFSHSGQKCSATSLLILEDEVFEDERFKAGLCDAVESLQVGSAFQLETSVGPLIRPPSGVLETGLKELEPGESWAVRPHRDEENPQLYSPGMKWGVTPGSLTHMTEFFGPVLGVMKAKNLREAVDMVNATGYGLTSGLESLDNREQELWKQSIHAGNLYINRGTTGAIVLRQPFGGMGKSAFGPGIKAGGPNYVAQLMAFSDESEPPSSENLLDEQLAEFREALKRLQSESHLLSGEDLGRTMLAIGSYDYYMREEFFKMHDHFRLIGQDNYRRYLPVPELRIRVAPDDSTFDIYARVCAAKVAGCRITVSLPPDYRSAALEMLEQLTEPWAGGIEFVEESDSELAHVVRHHLTDRVRFARPERVPLVVREAVTESGLYIADRPVLMHGRVELLWYVVEQSLSINYHRYGNLGARASEDRVEPL